MKFTAVGDMIIQQRIPEGYKGYEELRPFIERGDARFFNLETTLNEVGECPAAQLSGGTYIRTTPKVLGDIEKLGFNMMSFNNNHAFDFSHEGFMKTLEAVEATDFIHAGCGRNLAEASMARFLDTANGRVALIAVNTNFNPIMLAGEQTDFVQGRPGINGLLLDEKFEVNEEEFEFVKRLAETTGVNVARTISAKEGYYALPKDDEARFGELVFKKSDRTKWVRHVKKADMERVRKALEIARFQADEVIVSVHSHQLDGTKKEDISEFLQEFAPNEFYEKHSLKPEAGIYNLLKNRSTDFTVGLMEDKKMFETVIPYWETENGKLTKIELLPIMSKMDGNKSEIGLPRIAEDTSFMKRLNDISEPFGVRVVEKDGKFVCEW